MTNQVNEVLEKIREVCDLKRLEFGCEVEVEGKRHYLADERTPFFMAGYYKKSGEWDNWGLNSNQKRSYQVYETLSGEEIKTLEDKKRGDVVLIRETYADGVDDEVFDFQIIGLPVQLNHLLWAIFSKTKGVHKMTDDNYVAMTDEERITTYRLIERFDLQKSVEDNLRSNPELCSWVHGVIIGNE